MKYPWYEVSWEDNEGGTWLKQKCAHPFITHVNEDVAALRKSQREYGDVRNICIRPLDFADKETP